MLDAANDAHNRAPVGLVKAGAHPRPQRILIGPEAPHHRVVDDDDAWGALAVGSLDVATLEQGNAESREVIGTRGAVARPRLLRARKRWPELDLEIEAGVAAAEREVSGEARGLHAGQAPDPLQEPLVELRDAQAGIARR